MRFDPPDGYLCFGPHFCWAVYGWRPNKFQEVMLSWCFGVTWRERSE